MIEIIKELNIEVSKPNVFQAVVAKQYDMNTRFIKATFVDSGDKIHIDHNATVKVVINALRPDGEAGAFEGEVNEDGTVTVPLHSWMLEQVGTVICDISVIDMETDDNKKLTTTSFTLLVEKAAYGGEGITSDPQYDLLIELLNSCSEAGEVAEEALEKSNEAIARAEGVKGVYVGKGDMPDEYNVQIDPDGDALIVDSALDENSENLVQNKVVAKKINEIDTELGELGELKDQYKELQTAVDGLQEKETKRNKWLYADSAGTDADYIALDGLDQYKLFAIRCGDTYDAPSAILVYAQPYTWVEEGTNASCDGFRLATVQPDFNGAGCFQVDSKVLCRKDTIPVTPPQFGGTGVTYRNSTGNEEVMLITEIIGIC